MALSVSPTAQQALTEQEELWSLPLWLPLFCGGALEEQAPPSRGAGPLPLSLGPDRRLGPPRPGCRSGAPSQGSLRSQCHHAARRATPGGRLLLSPGQGLDRLLSREPATASC